MIVYYGVQRCKWERPFRVPRLHWNGGVPVKHAVTDISLLWGKRAVSVTIYWHSHNRGAGIFVRNPMVRR